MTRPSATDRLETWGEIASYLRRSVRTVRRWEADEGLPVHRLMHKTLASVYAFRSELDAWRESRESAESRGPQATQARNEEGGPSIAVLPFGYIGPEPEHYDYIADGLTDEVISALSKIHSLRVISRTSSMRLKGTDKEVGRIARELGVRHLLEGTVHCDRSQLRISTRLIDPSTDDRIWSERYEGTLEEVFTFQERIARSIVESLDVRLSNEEDRRIGERSIDELIAWRCLIQARQEALRWRRDSIDHAVRLLGEGLAVVGDSARLHAALGMAHLQYREAAVDLSDEPLKRAERCAGKVFELDPKESAGHLLLGWTRYARGRIQDAVGELKLSLETEPNHPDALGLLANCYLISGRIAAARTLIERLVSIDPLTPLTRCMPGWADVLEGNLEAAIGPYRQMFEMDPGNPMGRLFLVWILVLNQRQEDARKLVEDFSPSLVGSPPAQVAALLVAALDGAQFDDDRLVTPEIERLAAATDVFPRFLAQAYAFAGDAGRAVRWLSVAVERGFVNHPFLDRYDPALRRIRGHEPLEELLESVETRWREFEV